MSVSKDIASIAATSGPGGGGGRAGGTGATDAFASGFCETLSTRGVAAGKSTPLYWLIQRYEGC